MKTKGQRKAEDRRQYRRREKARDVAEITRETMLGRVVRRGHAVGRGCPTQEDAMSSLNARGQNE